jgi:DNA-binding IclR family transcriptional regulator
VDDGEFEEYVNCVAVPVHSADGTVRAGLSLTAVREIEPLETLKLNIPRLLAVAAEISTELGWDGQQGRSK